MKRFKFSLETLKKVRHRTEQIKQREFSLAVLAVNAAADDLKDTTIRAGQLQGALRNSRSGVIAIPAVLAGLQYKHHLEHVAVDQARKLAEASVEAENRRNILIEAGRQKKVIDRLREKKWRTHRLDMEREEQKVLDEVAGSAARRRKRTEEIRHG